MGYTLPKLPKVPNHLEDSPFEKSSMNRACESIDDSPLPEWVDVPDEFYAMSCKTRTFRDSQYLTVKFVPKPPCGGFNDGFVKVFMLMKDGSPFPHMNAIYSLVGESTIGRTYSISKDGKIRDKYMGFPSGNNIYDAIFDISCFYDTWREYPSIDDWGLVKDLEDAKKAVVAMYQEEKHQQHGKAIKELRDHIKYDQEEIARLDRELNRIYERAADAMNLLEKNGIEMNVVIEEDERKATA